MKEGRKFKVEFDMGNGRLVKGTLTSEPLKEVTKVNTIAPKKK